MGPYIGLSHYGCNSLENPIGIETLREDFQHPDLIGCNSLENPIGIETENTAMPLRTG